MTLENLPQQYSNFDVQMEWDIRISDRKTVIEGHICNIRYARMDCQAPFGVTESKEGQARTRIAPAEFNLFVVTISVLIKTQKNKMELSFRRLF